MRPLFFFPNHPPHRCPPRLSWVSFLIPKAKLGVIDNCAAGAPQTPHIVLAAEKRLLRAVVASKRGKGNQVIMSSRTTKTTMSSRNS